MSLIIGVIFGGVVLFFVCSWFSVKNPTVKNFWEWMEEKCQRPKGTLKISLGPDGQPSFEFHPHINLPVSGEEVYELEIPVTRWTVKLK